jgi:hypothetical protein
MTGQVKEDIISRFREIGIKIRDGKIIINPSLLRKEEFLKKEEMFTYYDLTGKEQKIHCRKNSFAITYCQVPFIYNLSNTEKIVVHKANEEVIKLDNLELKEEVSQSIFNRKGEIKKVEVFINDNLALSKSLAIKGVL